MLLNCESHQWKSTGSLMVAQRLLTTWRKLKRTNWGRKLIIILSWHKTCMKDRVKWTAFLGSFPWPWQGKAEHAILLISLNRNSSYCVMCISPPRPLTASTTYPKLSCPESLLIPFLWTASHSHSHQNSATTSSRKASLKWSVFLLQIPSMLCFFHFMKLFHLFGSKWTFSYWSQTPWRQGPDLTEPPPWSIGQVLLRTDVLICCLWLLCNISPRNSLLMTFLIPYSIMFTTELMRSYWNYHISHQTISVWR